MYTVADKASQSLLSDEEYKILNDFLDLIDTYGEDEVSVELCAVSQEHGLPEPHIFKWTEEDLNLLEEQYHLVGVNIPELRKKFTEKQIKKSCSFSSSGFT